ncbi:MAG: hypothetical protein H0Z37_06000 [Firmicutes bacterium]|nr:hypothetical protein [Bacillota bacterium]
MEGALFDLGNTVFNMDRQAVAVVYRDKFLRQDDRPVSLSWHGLFGLERGGFFTSAEFDFFVSDGVSVIVGASTANGPDNSGFAEMPGARRLWTALKTSF